MAWITANYINLLLAVAAFLSFAEIAVRLTPTKKDDGFVQRVGAVVKKVMDFLGIPNNLK